MEIIYVCLVICCGAIFGTVLGHVIYDSFCSLYSKIVNYLNEKDRKKELTKIREERDKGKWAIATETNNFIYPTLELAQKEAERLKTYWGYESSITKKDFSWSEESLNLFDSNFLGEKYVPNEIIYRGCTKEGKLEMKAFFKKENISIKEEFFYMKWTKEDNEKVPEAYVMEVTMK
jgi:hypothetical protein